MMIVKQLEPWAAVLKKRKSWLHLFSMRMMAVRELPWCAPLGSPNRRRKVTELSLEKPMEPVKSFGIIAAMARNRVIGVQGRIPWSLPEDRKLFESITTNRILIMGRRTLEEDFNRSHISHAARSIVISKTLVVENIETETLKVARSFSEALHLAKQLEVCFLSSVDEPVCWVVGGEPVYREALLHPAAACLHLTIVDTVIEELSGEKIARFPQSYYWDNKFYLESWERRSSVVGLNYEYFIYSRIKGRR